MVGFKAWIGDSESAALEMLITWSGDQVENIWDLNLSFQHFDASGSGD